MPLEGEGCIPNLQLLRKDGPQTLVAPRHGHMTFRFKEVEYCMLDTAAECNASAVRKRMTSLRARPLPLSNDVDAPAEVAGDGLSTISVVSGVTRALVCHACYTSLRHGNLPEASLVRIDAGLPPPDLEPLTPLEMQLVSLNRSMRLVSHRGARLLPNNRTVGLL